MSRRNKKAKTAAEYRFGGRIETTDLEQQIANLLTSFSLPLEKIQLKNTTSDIFTLLFNQGYFDEDVVLVPRSVLERAYNKLIESGFTKSLGKHPRLSSAEIQAKLKLQAKAAKKRK